MDVSALLTSAGINTGLCVVLFSLYSILRKQPGNFSVYFGRRLAQERIRPDNIGFDRLFPSASWIVKAWVTSEEEILAIGGLDAVVFLRILVFSIRIFSVAAIICLLLVLPLNYYGQDMIHKHISSESLSVFTIDNVKEGSKWLWGHCLAIYIISISACILLYFEYKNIAKLRLAHITRTSPNPSQFSVLVRSIPWSAEESYNVSVQNFFTNYHASSYISHQMVYRSGTFQKLLNDAHDMYKKLSLFKPPSVRQLCEPCLIRCSLCGTTSNSFKMLSHDPEQVEEKPTLSQVDVGTREQECAAAFVFFKTRYAAVVACQVLQSSNPMVWVTDLAPEPRDVYWSNLWIPYKQLWIRRVATLLASAVFVVVFLLPVTLVQGLSRLEQLQRWFPFLGGILKKKYVSQLVTGYLPSVVLLLFLLAAPPIMMLFAKVEGNISRSGRKKSACSKILYFTIWNVFFVNVFSGSLINLFNNLGIIVNIPHLLAKAVSGQAVFFTTYVLTSGWAGLACELMQICAFLCNICYKCALWTKEYPSNFALSFPYHTEIPRVLLFGLIGFTCSIMAPLILPFLLIYFVMAYVVYRNQILNVYVTKYESGGLYWPTVQNTVIFSLILAQIIALGVFGLKQSPVAAGFTIPLVILTLLFNEYCRQRFHPVFKGLSAQQLIDLDRRDEMAGGLEAIYESLRSAYSDAMAMADKKLNGGYAKDSGCEETVANSMEITPALANPTLDVAPMSGLRQTLTWLSLMITSERRSTKCREAAKE